jgi:uncharacterized protein (UPF0276 family)
VVHLEGGARKNRAMSKVSGIGLGLRRALARDLLETPPPELSWLEVAPENYMRRGGYYPETLTRCAERWPIVTHGLSMSLGGLDPFDSGYMKTLEAFLERVETPWHSDHLCFTSVDGVHLHDLMPVPFSAAMVEHLAGRIRQAQDQLDLPFAVENISYYALPGPVEMDEADFVHAVVDAAGCGLLLDVNNVFVNATNHGFDPYAMLAKYPLERVVQIHVAGHDVSDPRLVVDTHAEPIREEVYELLAFALERTGPVPVLLERDGNFPAWNAIHAELKQLRALWERSASTPDGAAP